MSEVFGQPHAAATIGGRGSRTPEPGARRRAGVPRAAGLALGGQRRARLRGDDRSPGRAAREAGRGGPVQHAAADPRGARVRRHGQGALPHPRRPRRRGRADALPRRPPLDLRLLAVRLPADVHVLRHRDDEVRPQPDRGRDPRPGAALPPHRARRPPRVHGHGRADDEPGQRPRRVAQAAGRRDHAPPHRHLHRRLGAGHQAADRDRHADPARALPARARGRAALADHAGQRALPAGRGARGLRGAL